MTRYLVLLNLIGGTLLVSPCLAENPYPVASGSALAELGAVPPAPPAGFATSDEAISAVRSGKVPVANPFLPLPKNIIVKRNIEYGNSGSRPLLLDLYSPRESAQAAPGLIFIHGGSWRGGRKEDYRPYAMHYAAKGYVVASIQYRLSKEAPFPAAVHDVKAAVRFMRAEAESLGVDAGRIGVAGGSAGGHLSMMIAYSSDVSALDGNSGHPGVSSRVQCIVNLYGPTDMTTEYARNISESNKNVSAFFKGTYKEQPDSYAAGSPLKYVTQDDPPTLILHGTVDDLVPVNQADILAKRLAELEIPYVYDRLPGWPHAMDLAEPVHERCLWYMDHFLDRFLKQTKTTE